MTSSSLVVNYTPSKKGLQISDPVSSPEYFLMFDESY